MSDPRFIALKLAALPEGDRRWLLRQLTKAERQQIQPGLVEALTLPPAALLRALEAAAPDEAASTAAPLQNVELAPLRSAAGAKVVALMSVLPISCTALLLEKGPWPWGNELNISLTSDERRTLPKALVAVRGRVSPRFEALLFEQIGSALADTAGIGAKARNSQFDKILGD